MHMDWLTRRSFQERSLITVILLFCLLWIYKFHPNKHHECVCLFVSGIVFVVCMKVVTENARDIIRSRIYVEKYNKRDRVNNIDNGASSFIIKKKRFLFFLLYILFFCILWRRYDNNTYKDIVVTYIDEA